MDTTATSYIYIYLTQYESKNATVGDWKEDIIGYHLFKINSYEPHSACNISIYIHNP